MDAAAASSANLLYMCMCGPGSQIPWVGADIQLSVHTLAAGRAENAVHSLCWPRQNNRDGFCCSTPPTAVVPWPHHALSTNRWSRIHCTLDGGRMGDDACAGRKRQGRKPNIGA